MDSTSPKTDLSKHLSKQNSQDEQGAPTTGGSKRVKTTRLGIIGGKGVGKSYLFQAMVYRTYSNDHAGSLAYYLGGDSITLDEATERTRDKATERTRTHQSKNLVAFIKNYEVWNRLLQTTQEQVYWYRLRLPYQAGFFGSKSLGIDVEFFDGSGEGHFAIEDVFSTDSVSSIWKEAFLEVQTMVFCLPLWVAFPNTELSKEHQRVREDILQQFERVIMNYREFQKRNQQRIQPRSILALTMADDQRSALNTLRDNWITLYMQNPEDYLPRLRNERWITLYLAQARKISKALYVEFKNSRDHLVNSIPSKIEGVSSSKPWLVPLSAIDGRRLAEIERIRETDDPSYSPSLPPVPVHVELPLLVALCEWKNALM